MGPLPFAFSVSHFINSVGAKAGFAALIGLAVLVLLYFAQARETSSLREQAHEAAQRVQQLEARIAQLARQPGVAQPAPATAAIAPQPAAQPAQSAARPEAARAVSDPLPVAAGAVSALAVAPAPPAGVGAPALSAATRLIPEVALLAPPAPVTAAPAPVSAPEMPSESSQLRPGPPPATVAGAANGTKQPVSAVGVGGTGQAPPRIQIRPEGSPLAGRRPAPAPRAPTRNPSSRGRRVLAAGLVILSVAAVVVLLLVLTSSGANSSSSTSAAATNATASTTAHKRVAPGVTPSAVTVSVLNGTASSGLAHRVAVKLTGTGYRQGTVATATDQTRTATVVAYMPGHRREAIAVATSLKLGPASVQPLDQNTQAVACPPPGACTSAVVVTVGSDLANIQ